MTLRSFHRFRSYFFQVPWCVPSWGWAEWRATVSCVLRGHVVRGLAIQRFEAVACHAVLDQRHALREHQVVVVPHLCGRIAPIDQIKTLLAARGIPLIDDAAQALGMQCGGRRVGTFGQCGILSVGPGKSL